MQIYPCPCPSSPLRNPPQNAVQLYYNGRPLLPKIRSTLHSDMYRASVRVTICKQEGWSTHQFNQVDWLAHEFAFQSTWSSKRVTYTKLVHNLLKNYRFYGKSELCPCCLLTKETMQHMFTCPALGRSSKIFYGNT